MTFSQIQSLNTSVTADRLFGLLPPKARNTVQCEASDYFCGLRDSGGGQCLQEDSSFSNSNTWGEDNGSH